MINYYLSLYWKPLWGSSEVKLLCSRLTVQHLVPWWSTPVTTVMYLSQIRPSVVVPENLKLNPKTAGKHRETAEKLVPKHLFMFLFSITSLSGPQLDRLTSVCEAAFVHLTLLWFMGTCCWNGLYNIVRLWLMIIFISG